MPDCKAQPLLTLSGLASRHSRSCRVSLPDWHMLDWQQTTLQPACSFALHEPEQLLPFVHVTLADADVEPTL